MLNDKKNDNTGRLFFKIVKKTLDFIRRHKKQSWAVFVGIAVILAAATDFGSLYDRFVKSKRAEPVTIQPNAALVSDKGSQPNSQAPILSATKEYIFGNKFAYVQAITDTNNKVIAYGITSTVKDFSPSFTFLESAFEADPKNPNDRALDKSLAFTVKLNITRFSDLLDTPEKVSMNVGARRFSYDEEYYYGNPGNYQTYIFAVNDAGYSGQVGELRMDGEDFKPDSEYGKQFRQQTVINTIFVTRPLEIKDYLKQGRIGPDLDQVRVIPVSALSTKDSSKQYEAKLQALSTEVNIEYFMQRLGDPLIINDLSDSSN